MLIVRYWSVFHLYAQLKVSLVYLSISLVMAEFSTSSSARYHHPLPNLFPPLICLLSAYSLICPFLFLSSRSSLSPSSLCRSHRCIALVDIAVCFRPRVDEEGALGCGVDLFSALILIGVAYSWLTGPAWRNQILSSTFTFLDSFPNNNELPEMQNPPHT